MATLMYNEYYTASSMIVPPVTYWSGSAAKSHPAIASCRFASSSSSDSPWVKHPGNAGTSAQTHFDPTGSGQTD